MGFIKKLDIFREVNEEHKEGTCLGAILTIICMFIIIFFFSKELALYRFQKLDTKLFVMNSDRDLVNIKYDITVYHIPCHTLIIGTETSFGMVANDKVSEGDGCRVKGEFLSKNDNNSLTIAPNFQSSLNEMIGIMFMNSKIN